MTPPADPPYELEVSRADLAQALKTVARAIAKHPGDACFRLEDGCLSIEAGNTAADAPARGTWSRDSGAVEVEPPIGIEPSPRRCGKALREPVLGTVLGNSKRATRAPGPIPNQRRHLDFGGRLDPGTSARRESSRGESGR